MRKIRVRAIIPHGDKVLLVKNKQSQGDFYCLPGGGVEEGELVTDALRREIKEELGVDAVIGRLLVLAQIKDDDYYSDPELWFHITNGADFSDIDLAKTSHGEREIADLGFFDINSVYALPRELTTLIPRFAEQHYQGPTIVTSSLRDPITF